LKLYFLEFSFLLSFLVGKLVLPKKPEVTN